MVARGGFAPSCGDISVSLSYKSGLYSLQSEGLLSLGIYFPDSQNVVLHLIPAQYNLYLLHPSTIG